MLVVVAAADYWAAELSLERKCSEIGCNVMCYLCPAGLVSVH